MSLQELFENAENCVHLAEEAEDAPSRLKVRADARIMARTHRKRSLAGRKSDACGVTK
jgi:hypothetical protein